MNNAEWRGYPLRKWPTSEGKWDWEILLDGKWVEIVTDSYRLIESEAEESLNNYAKHDPLT